MTDRKLRVLCLDIEGGYGGSSRSLFQSLRHMAGGELDIQVWCRKDGPIQERYRDLDIGCRVEPDMPTVTSLPRVSRNLLAFARFGLKWMRSRSFRRRLLEACRDVDLVHLNHESLFWLARWLARHSNVALTMHVRTRPQPTGFARLQYRTIASAVDHTVFITENEHRHAEFLAARAIEGSAIYNIPADVDDSTQPHPLVPRDRRLKAGVLANYDWVHGTDRLVDVAEALRRMARTDIVFIMAGNMTLSRSLPGELGAIGRRGGGLDDYVKERDLGDYFIFLGHVSEPEQVLAACDVLAKPTRGHNPWGRDIIEAMAAGIPVLTVGSWNRFVEHGMTGIMHPEFDASAMAGDLAHLADQRCLLTELGTRARDRIMTLCNGPDRAADLAAAWRRAVTAHSLS